MIDEGQRNRRKVIQEGVESSVFSQGGWELPVEEPEPHGGTGRPKFSQLLLLTWNDVE